MIIFYSALIVLCVYMELSNKVNTDNILNKIAIGFVIVGALLKIYAQTEPLPHENHLIAIGVFLHFVCELRFYHKNFNRRSGDRKPV